MGYLNGLRVVLNSNSNMLRKTNLFKKDKSFLSSRKEYLKAAKGNVDFKSISKSELKALREKVIRNRKKESLRAWLLTIAIITPFIVIGFYFFNSSNQNEDFEKDKSEQILVEQKLTEDLNEFNYLIEDGDNWILKRNWNNAIFRYKQAVKLFPNEFEGNYRLALTYSYTCQETNENCELGKKITNRLVKSFPNDSRLIKLMAAFD